MDKGRRWYYSVLALAANLLNYNGLLYFYQYHQLVPFVLCNELRFVYKRLWRFEGRQRNGQHRSNWNHPDFLQIGSVRLTLR